MSLDPASLPRDPDRLIEMLLELHAENARLQSVVATFQRALFGPRSEKFDAEPAQLPLDLDDAVHIAPTAAANNDNAAPPGKPHLSRARAARNIGALPKHLPRCEVVIEPESTICPCCQGPLHIIGEDVSEMLDVVPAVLQVKRIGRPRYGCRSCESAVVQAKAPPRLVENGMATTALVAHVAVAKFSWHLPLNRQTQILHGHGIELDRSTLVHWIMRAAWWLKPLHALLAETVLSAPKVFCDDTPLPVLDRRRRRTRTARFWCYAVDDRPWRGPAAPAVVYLFAEDRKGRHVHEHLARFSGVLQVDAYAGYQELTRPDRPGGAVTLAFCLAHARRRFFEIYEATGSAVAEQALQQLRTVYEIEERIRGLTATERTAVRQAETRPLLEGFKLWLMAQLAEVSAKSALADAIKYMLGHWDGLTVFLDDGRVELDSNTNDSPDCPRAPQRAVRRLQPRRRSLGYSGIDHQHREVARARSGDLSRRCARADGLRPDQGERAA